MIVGILKLYEIVSSSRPPSADIAGAYRATRRHPGLILDFHSIEGLVSISYHVGVRSCNFQIDYIEAHQLSCQLRPMHEL